MLYILNIFDLIITLYFTNLYGIETEANPFGVILLNNPVLLIIYKVILVGLCCIIIRRYKILYKIMTALFGGLAIYHLFWVIYLSRLITA